MLTERQALSHRDTPIAEQLKPIRVLDQNLLSCPPEQSPQIQPLISLLRFRTRASKAMKRLILLTICLFLLHIKCDNEKPQSPGRKKCTARELQKCMSFLQVVTGGKDTALPASRAELKRTCSDLKTGVKCLDKHSGSCFSQEQALVFEDLVTPAKEFINQLCDNGRTEAEFLRYASCYRNISLDADKCAGEYGEAVQASSNATESLNPEKSIKRSCCSLRTFIQCKYDYVGRDCGNDAETFMRNHLGHITHPLLERHCAAYTFGSHACAEVMQRNDGTNSALRADPSVIVFVLAVIVLTIRRTMHALTASS